MDHTIFKDDDLRGNHHGVEVGVDDLFLLDLYDDLLLLFRCLHGESERLQGWKKRFLLKRLDLRLEQQGHVYIFFRKQWRSGVKTEVKQSREERVSLFHAARVWAR
jgi:hypothetical protein